MTWGQPRSGVTCRRAWWRRHDHLPDRPRAAGLGALADLGFTGLDPDPEDPVIITGYKSTRTSKTTPAQRHANQALSAARAPVEHGFSDLENWRILTRLRLSPANATTRPARPHPPAHQPLTDDHDLCPPGLRTSARGNALHRAPSGGWRVSCRGRSND